MDNSNKEIMGVVVWQNNRTHKCLIRCKKSNNGNDGILTPNPENPVKIGDSVKIILTKAEYNKYFLNNENKLFPKFEATNYIVLPEIYKIAVQLTENQYIIEHHFFGKIYNNSHLSFPTGTGTIIIRRGESKNGEWVWMLEKVESVQEPPRKKVIGIVVSHHLGTTYVWCKERPVAHDVTLKRPSDGRILPVGTWITFTVEKSIFEVAFSGASSSNGFVAKYEIEQYDIMENPIHPTELTGMNQSTVNIKLKGYIEQNLNVEDIWHPFVGLIINESFKFPVSGSYIFTVFRAKPKENPPRSVWYLKNPQLVSQPPRTIPSPPVRQESTLERQLRYMSMDNLSAGVTNQPSSSNQAEASRSSRPVHQDAVPPTPAPRKHRSQSRRNRSASRRRRSASRPREPPVKKIAMIFKIKNYGRNEDVYCWLLDDNEQGQLKLDVPAEEHKLKSGSVFSADFVLKGKVWISDDGDSIEPNNDPFYKYETRVNGLQGIDIHVYASSLRNAGMVGNKYPTIDHHHFGNIIDNFNRLQYHERMKYHMWIRRVNLDGKFEWVVIEQII